MSNSVFVEMHCHPSLKPFGRSYPEDENSKNLFSKSSVWHRNAPNPLTKILNKTLSITRFTQSDFKSMAMGSINVACISLYPLERNFLVSKLGQGALVDILSDWVIGIGQQKVNFIQENKNYFSELIKEMQFIEQLHDKKVRIGFKKWKYKLVVNYREILQNLESGERVISVIPSIEGAHAFMIDNRNEPDTDSVMNNIDQVLAWKYKPFFISPAHHFYNYMCGHAYSLSQGLRIILDQKTGVNTGITLLGWKIIEKLLANRVYIDIKHMSRQARREYYKLLSKPEYNHIPVIISHGAVNGRPTVQSNDDHDEENGKFFGSDINFYDDEIVNLAKSKGLFCIQLDEKRIVSKTERKKADDILLPAKKLEFRAGFVWNQVEHIACILDTAGTAAWDCVSIGSDNDGIIDPIEGFWTSGEIPKLRSYLFKHAKKFAESAPTRMKEKDNHISPERIIDKLFGENALEFLKKFYV